MFALQLTVMHRFSTAIHLQNHYMYIQISRNSYDNSGSATQDRFESENIFRCDIRAKSSSFEVHIARYDRVCERRNALNALEQIRVSNRTLNTSSRRRTCRRVKRV